MACTTVHQVDGLLVGLEEEVAGVDTGDIDGLEEALHRWGGAPWSTTPPCRFSSHPVLHHKHFLVVELSHSLVFAYSSIRPHLTRWGVVLEEVVVLLVEEVLVLVLEEVVVLVVEEVVVLVLEEVMVVLLHVCSPD